jgi:hypothetical protein
MIEAVGTIDSCRTVELGIKVFYFNDLALAFGPYSASTVPEYPGKNPAIWV